MVEHVYLAVPIPETSIRTDSFPKHFFQIINHNFIYHKQIQTKYSYKQPYHPTTRLQAFIMSDTYKPTGMLNPYDNAPTSININTTKSSTYPFILIFAIFGHNLILLQSTVVSKRTEPQTSVLVPVVCLKFISPTMPTNLVPFPCHRSWLSRQLALTVSEFAHGKVDPTEAGKKGGEIGGQTSGDSSGGSSGGNSGGSSSGQFAHGKVDPVEAGKKGGSS